MEAPVVFFYVFAALALAGAVGMVANVRNAVASAMCLVLTMISLAGIYALLGAHLVAVFQIMVYGGAIVVLFLFVVMLLDVGSERFEAGRQLWLRLLGGAAALAAAAALVRLLAGRPEPPPLPAGFGGYRQLGVLLYTDYVLLVEVASLLLLAAIVGALILAKRRID